MHEIKRYSQISRDTRIVIDNYNSHTDNICVIEKITLIPVYHVFGRNKTTGKVVGEKFFLDEVFANKYWSILVGEKEYLF